MSRPVGENIRSRPRRGAHRCFDTARPFSSPALLSFSQVEQQSAGWCYERPTRSRSGTSEAFKASPVLCLPVTYSTSWLMRLLGSKNPHDDKGVPAQRDLDPDLPRQEPAAQVPGRLSTPACPRGPGSSPRRAAACALPVAWSDPPFPWRRTAGATSSSRTKECAVVRDSDGGTARRRAATACRGARARPRGRPPPRGGARAWAAPTGKGDGSCVRRDGRAAGMIGWALTAEFCVKGAFSENEYNGFYHLRENENVK